jgi:hypothetical protein
VIVLRVNIIGKANGVGLTRDLRILTDVLRNCGCEVSATIVGSRQSGWRKSLLRKSLKLVGLTGFNRGKPKYDINVMLEHVWVQYMVDARINVVVPNPDYFDRHDVAALSEVDQVWAKTHSAQQIFQQLGCAVALIGFDSEDRFDASCARTKTFFHLAGSSSLKGTARLVEIWSRHPEWPELTVVGRFKTAMPFAKNIKYYTEFMNDVELQILQNSHAIHLCTSETEGWGHYLVEALSVAAVTITLDAPPMNELVSTDRGVLLACRAGKRHRLAQCYLFDEAALVNAIETMIGLPQQEIARLGTRGREWFRQNQAGFATRIRAALDALIS